MSSFQLLSNESKLFELIKLCAQSFDFATNPPRLLTVSRYTVSPRVAGGWVRNKLLQRETNDIDVVLDTCTGSKFAVAFRDWLRGQGYTLNHFKVIPRKPEQSRHLETAKFDVLGFSLDFVNLRTKDYSDPRIRSVKFGTASEDATRRDLTINSLFYNLATDKIEDLTGLGLSDIKAGLIRTPIPPKQTLLDDPLRLLRAIRFASEFAFKLDDNLKRACGDADVLEALNTKVTRQRIGAEVIKMLSSETAYIACTLIADTDGLAEDIFTLPPVGSLVMGSGEASPVPTGIEKESARGLVIATRLDNERIKAVLNRYGLGHEYDSCFYLAAILYPYAELMYKAHDGTLSLANSYIITKSLRRPNKEADIVSMIHSSAIEFSAYLQNADNRSNGHSPQRQPICGLAQKHRKRSMQQQIHGQGCQESEGYFPITPRVLLGRIIRNSPKLTWLMGLFVAAIWNCNGTDVGDKRYMLPTIQLLEQIELLDLQDADKMDLFSEKELKALLPRTPKGPAIRTIIDVMTDWMLANPNVTREDCRRRFLYKSFYSYM